jgi:hypothetical protein
MTISWRNYNVGGKQAPFRAFAAAGMEYAAKSRPNQTKNMTTTNAATF